MQSVSDSQPAVWYADLQKTDEDLGFEIRSSRKRKSSNVFITDSAASQTALRIFTADKNSDINIQGHRDKRTDNGVAF